MTELYSASPKREPTSSNCTRSGGVGWKGTLSCLSLIWAKHANQSTMQRSQATDLHRGFEAVRVEPQRLGSGVLSKHAELQWKNIIGRRGVSFRAS